MTIDYTALLPAKQFSDRAEDRRHEVTESRSQTESAAHNRADITRQRLDLIRTAVVGDGVTAGRFVADMGRLPMVQEATEGLTLNELWEKPSSIAYSTVSMSPAWPESITGLPATVELDCGWNGPYLLLGTGKLYGYLADGGAAANAWSSGLLTLELKLGANFVTVHLTEKLN